MTRWTTARFQRRLGDTIDQKMLARAGDNLRLIANYGAGFDHIDVETARTRGIKVSNMMGHRITGKRLGILGMGRIGQAVARRASAFGLQVHYHNRRKRELISCRSIARIRRPPFI